MSASQQIPQTQTLAQICEKLKQARDKLEQSHKKRTQLLDQLSDQFEVLRAQGLKHIEMEEESKDELSALDIATAALTTIIDFYRQRPHFLHDTAHGQTLFEEASMLHKHMLKRVVEAVEAAKELNIHSTRTVHALVNVETKMNKIETQMNEITERIAQIDIRLNQRPSSSSSSSASASKRPKP